MNLISLLAMALLTVVPLWAQAQKPAELPEAPSAAIQPKPAPPPPPQQQHPQTPPPGENKVVPTPAAPEAKPSEAKPSQDSASAEKEADIGGPVATIRRRVNEVNVIFTVTDKKGRFIKDLKSADIRVLDDRKPPTSIVSFRTETDLPLRVGLLVDESNSVRDRFKFEQDAAIEFLSQIVRPKSDRAFVLGFDQTAEITADFTDDSEKLSKGVRMLRPGGGTALYDAVYFACRDKLMKINPGEGVRRAIILISDGEDNQSRVTREEAIEMAQRAEVIIYAISTNVSGLRLHGDKVLERIAEATGGRAFFPLKIEEIADFFSAVQDELRSQYMVAYRPADFLADGRFRSIEIVAENKKYQVRARKGYYAPTQ